MAADTLYTTKALVKAAIQKTGADMDDVIDDLIEAASRAIDNYTNHPDGWGAPLAASARTYAGSGVAYQRIDPCSSITLVEVKDSPTDTTYTSWGVGDWIGAKGDPEAPNFNQRPYDLLLVDPTGDYSFFTSGQFAFRKGFRPDPDVPYRGVPTVRVTASWGDTAAVPATIAQACIMQVARWLKRGESAWADTVGSADAGMLLYRKELDPDIAFILRGGRLIRPAVG